MAKTKPTATPKKGAKAITQAMTTLRRSPRKVVQSAKKLAADEDVAATKVVKKTALKKKTSKETTPSKSTLPKKTAKAPAANLKKTKSPSPAKSAAPATEEEETTSPKRRGRPRKEVEVTVAKPTARSTSRISSRTRSQAPDDFEEVSLSAVGKTWTDSPKKRAPAKAKPGTTAVKAGAKRTPSPNKATGIRAASVGGVRKSIEVADDGQRGRSKSPVKTASKDISPERPKPSAKSKAENKSRRSISRSRSPSKPSELPFEESDAAEDVPNNSKRGRSTSPRKKAAGRQSQSPNKANERRKSLEVPRSTTSASKAQSSRSRGRPRSSSVGAQPSQLNVPKTRPSTAAKPSSPGKRGETRSATPTKKTRGASGARRASDPTQSPGGPRVKSPTKLSGRAKDLFESSSPSAFEKRFQQRNDYGKALRQVERYAYHRRKGNQQVLVGGRHPQITHISSDDETRAREKGIRRAELEITLRSDGRKPPGVNPPKDGQSPTRGRQSPIRASQSPARKRQVSSGPSATRNQLARSPSQPPRQLSPGTYPNRNRSPARKSSTTEEDSTPMPKGQPSAPNRGTIHSVTNPEFIPETSTVKKNPFFETMPAPEVWHRRMPPFLPFGETPFMEKEMSRQITADLSRGADKNQSQGILSRSWSYLTGGSDSPKQQQAYESPWELPKVDQKEVANAAEQLRNAIDGRAGGAVSKRKASSPHSPVSKSPAKRVKRRSREDEGPEYAMSGGLD